MKRKREAADVVWRRLAHPTSALINCPACGRPVSPAAIGMHLDTDCPSSPLFPTQRHKGPDSTAPAPLPPPSPSRNSGAPLAAKIAGQDSNLRSGAQSAVGGADRWWLASGGREEICVRGRFAGDGIRRPLAISEVNRMTPWQVVRDALPGALADRLLSAIAADAGEWVRGTWWMFQRKCTAPRSSAFFDLSGSEGSTTLPPTDEDACREVSAYVTTRPTPDALREAAEIINRTINDLRRQRTPEEPNEDWRSTYALANWYKDGQDCVGAHSDRLTSLGPRPIIASLSLGATRVLRVKKEQSQSEKGAHEGGKRAALAAGRSGRLECLWGGTAWDNDSGPATPSVHSSPAAPSPVSLTSAQLESRPEVMPKGQPDPKVGSGSKEHIATQVNSNEDTAENLRILEGTLEKQNCTESVDAKPMTGASCAKTKHCSTGELTSLDIPMPHNTLVIMWPPAQEAWRHEVPRSARVAPHAISGTARLNLTFRQRKPEWAERAPKCKCGRQSAMKAKVGSGEGVRAGQPMGPWAHGPPYWGVRYFYMCDNARGPPCGFFQWAEL